MTQDLRIVFMGTPEFAVPSLQALADAGLAPVLCVSQPDRPQGRKRQIVPTPVHRKADELGIPCIQPEKVRNLAFSTAIADAKPDFIVTAAYGRILTPEVLAIPRLCAVNVHGSLLPKYRGASPVQAALINQDTETGVTILQMTEAMDQGPIYRQASFTIPPDFRADDLMLALAELGSSILVDTLLDIASGTLKPQPQNEAEASYVSLLDKTSGYVDWQQTAGQLEGLIRGAYPWPQAQACFDGKQAKLLAGSASTAPEDALTEMSPGTVISTQYKKIWCQTGEGVLCITELQFAGSRAMSSVDCAHNFRPGQTFANGGSCS